MKKFITSLLLTILFFINCSNTSNIEEKVNEFKNVKLNTDLSQLAENQKQMLPLLFRVADIMDSLFWIQAYGNKSELLSSVEDENVKKFIKINYGPWERLDGNKPFLKNFREKPKGANFYPQDMTLIEFNNFEDSSKTSLYTVIGRKSKDELMTIPYSIAYRQALIEANKLLHQAADLAEDEGLKNYLAVRADDLLRDDYYASDIAWMDMKTNKIDFVFGPIENYEDQLFGYKAAFEAFILIKDMEWSQRLEKYAAFLPELQAGLPVDSIYKQEDPGTDSELGAYEVIYYAGDCNAGSKTIAFNLPNDERIHTTKGSKRHQLKNTMKAKFDEILLPISGVLIAEDQRKHVTFDAFFENTMFHEVAHGLGIKNTIDGTTTVRKALKEGYAAIEEGKADILGLYMVTKLHEKGELTNNLMDNYVTFMAGIFRSVRFGASSAHGKANLMRFNYFKEKGAFVKNENGTYSVDFEKMQEAMNSLSALIITLQGNGDYEGSRKLIDEKGVIGPQLQSDLDKLKTANIPVDIIFEQGLEVLGL